MNIIIRHAVDKDYPVIIAALKEFAVFQKSPPEKVTNTAELMHEEKDFFKCFVAEDGQGDFIGMATFCFVYYSWSGKSIYLDDLYVKLDYRNFGVGKLLLDKVFQFAKAENCKRIQWMVSDWNNNAIDFYIKCGAEIHKDEYLCYISQAAIDNYIKKIR